MADTSLRSGPPSDTSAVNPSSLLCPTCGHRAAWPRRFCGACRAVLSHRCAACGFANELDDAWCGGCGGALAAPADPAAASAAKAPVRPAPPRAARPLPPLPAPPASAGAALAARLLEANRRGAAPRATPAAQDQDQLDALFAGEP